MSFLHISGKSGTHFKPSERERKRLKEDDAIPRQYVFSLACSKVGGAYMIDGQGLSFESE